MKYSIPMKLVVFLLTGCMLVACVVSAAGVIQVGERGLYSEPLEDMRETQVEDACLSMSYYLAQLYALENLSGIPRERWYPMGLMESIESHLYHTNADNLVEGKWHYQLTDAEGTLLQSSGNIPQDANRYTITTNFDYVHLVATVTAPYADTTLPPESTAPDAEEAQDETATPVLSRSAQEGLGGFSQQIPNPGTYDWSYEWMDPLEETIYTYYLKNAKTPTYTVTIYVEPDGYRVYSAAYYAITDLLWTHRFTLIYTLVGSLLLFILGAVYLCCAAGRTGRSHEIQPGGLNRLPLDLYLAGAGGGVVLLVVLFAEILQWSINVSLNYGGLVLCGLIALAGAYLVLGFFYALAAQVKAGPLVWWRNSLLGRFFDLTGRGLRRLGQTLHALYRLLPIVWRWLLISGGLGGALLLTIVLWFANRYNYSERLFITLLVLVVLAACVTVVCYGAYCFGTLLEGARRMAKGDLHSKVSTKYLWGSFADCANQLNALSDVAEIAAKNQLKSERMKTELITNVSHDIKTPLTSIINYVDLISKATSQQEAMEYIEVLSRQSLRLKKLIEDLMEMSKASTGNLTVNIDRVDAVETVNQALGEFSDKLASAQLIPVFRQPETPVYMHCDGRLAWRVMSNLLSNAVKYALPGTRLYIDLIQLEGNVLISLKNISREELNVSSEELMERFVRGDRSRNTEGSGLGLNIAKSLMEAQRGQLQLLVDGDLFKVTLVFPGA